MAIQRIYSLQNELDRAFVETLIDDATAQLVNLQIESPLYQLNDLERVILAGYVSEGTDEFELLARLRLQLHSDLEQVYLSGIVP